MVGKIFVNYRRDDSAAHALNIAQYLERAFGANSVFIDVDRLRAGQTFPKVLEQRLSQSDCMLTVIGPSWLDIRNEDGARRIDDPDDWVRMEIERALTRGVTLIPITVAGAKLPSQQQLPEPLKPLIERHAINLTTNGFRAEMASLVQDIKASRPSRVRRVGAIAAVAAIALATAAYAYRTDLISVASQVTASVLGPSAAEIKAREDKARQAAEEEARRQREQAAKQEEQAEQSAYAIAQAADSAAAWRTFLAVHPTGVHSSTATSRLGELERIEEQKRQAAEQEQRRAAERQARLEAEAEEQRRAEEAKQAAFIALDGEWTVRVCPQSSGCTRRACSPLYPITIRNRQFTKSSGFGAGLPAAISDEGEFNYKTPGGTRNWGLISGDTGTGKFSSPETKDDYGCSGTLTYQRAK